EQIDGQALSALNENDINDLLSSVGDGRVFDWTQIKI
ncbi:unnamed protein product, partial [Didymodactylos carnosus]